MGEYYLVVVLDFVAVANLKFPDIWYPVDYAIRHNKTKLLLLASASLIVMENTEYYDIYILQKLHDRGGNRTRAPSPPPFPPPLRKISETWRSILQETVQVFIVTFWGNCLLNASLEKQRIFYCRLSIYTLTQKNMSFK